MHSLVAIRQKLLRDDSANQIDNILGGLGQNLPGKPFLGESYRISMILMVHPMNDNEGGELYQSDCLTTEIMQMR